MAEAESQKTCFVIAPIGDRRSADRRRSDQVFEHIVKPVTSKLDYRQPPVRADRISEPGMITNQIIEHLLNDELVVADLSGRNPNVFYELAIRHAVRKPVVIMIAEGEDIPFDVSQSRAVQFDHRDLDSVASCKEALEQQIRALENNPSNVFSPISNAIDLTKSRESEDPSAQLAAHILTALEALQADLSRLERRINMYGPIPHRANAAAVDVFGGSEQSPTDEARNRALFFKYVADLLIKGDDEPQPDRDTETNNEE